MRARSFLVLLAAVVMAPLLGFASPAAAQTVAIAAPSFGQAMADRLRQDFGDREAPVLRSAMMTALEAALRSQDIAIAGGGAVDAVIETEIRDAKPNRPTFAQAGRQPGLDTFRSISIGGAEIVGRVRLRDGRILAETRYVYYEPDIRYSFGQDTWGDARRAMRMFSQRLAKTYKAQASQ